MNKVVLIILSCFVCLFGIAQNDTLELNYSELHVKSSGFRDLFNSKPIVDTFYTDTCWKKKLSAKVKIKDSFGNIHIGSIERGLKVGPWKVINSKNKLIEKCHFDEDYCRVIHFNYDRMVITELLTFYNEKRTIRFFYLMNDDVTQDSKLKAIELQDENRKLQYEIKE